MEKVKTTADSSDKESTKVESNVETVEVQSLEVPIDGDRSVAEGTEVEFGEEKQDGERLEEGTKTKDEKLSEKKLWMDFEDFCKCFG